ncbi:hypothetical protein EG832_09815 [bacterium]|nr:hypothetical protein [bacterium]
MKRGIMSLTLNDNVVVTDLAYEKANRLGMSLISPKNAQPPAAPIRPYIAKEQKYESIELKMVPSPTFINLEQTFSIENKPTTVISADSTKVNGLTSTAVIQNDEPNQNAGYPKPINANRIDTNDLQRRVMEELQLRFGKIDTNLLEKAVQRVFVGMGIE